MDPESGSGGANSSDYGKTYPPSILLGPWRFARPSHSLMTIMVKSGWLPSTIASTIFCPNVFSRLAHSLFFMTKGLPLIVNRSRGALLGLSLSLERNNIIRREVAD